MYLFTSLSQYTPRQYTLHHAQQLYEAELIKVHTATATILLTVDNNKWQERQEPTHDKQNDKWDQNVSKLQYVATYTDSTWDNNKYTGSYHKLSI
jgi:hypothetical protein